MKLVLSMDFLLIYEAKVWEPSKVKLTCLLCLQRLSVRRLETLYLSVTIPTCWCYYFFIVFLSTARSNCTMSLSQPLQVKFGTSNPRLRRLGLKPANCFLLLIQFLAATHLRVYKDLAMGLRLKGWETTNILWKVLQLFLEFTATDTESFSRK